MERHCAEGGGESSPFCPASLREIEVEQAFSVQLRAGRAPDGGNVKFHPYSEIFPLLERPEFDALIERYGPPNEWMSLNKSQRAMIAAHFVNAARRQAREQAKRKESWIASARKSFRPGAQKPCAICNGYVSVTHAHHIVPLWRQFNSGADAPDHSHVWLCPTHHAGVHLFLTKRSAWPCTAGFPPDEVDQMIKLALRGLGEGKGVAHAA